MVISEISFIMKSVPEKQQHISPTKSNTVLSIATATSILIVLYLPRCLLAFFLSPVTISTLLVLAILLHFGPEPDNTTITDFTARRQEANQLPPTAPIFVQDVAAGFNDLGSSRNSIIHEDVPSWWWCLDGPLEVIYEEEEDDNKEEEEEEEEEDDDDDDSLENVRYPWMENRYEDQYEEEEMIEINFDEENMIEIDLTKYRDLNRGMN